MHRQISNWNSTARSPFRSLWGLDSNLQGLFYNIENNTTNDLSQDQEPEPHFTPSCDVEETENQFILNFDLPGVESDQINVEIKDNLLTVSGERVHSNSTEGHYERKHGKFERKFTLTEETKQDSIEGNYQNGVLTLVIPKVEQKKPLVKKITITNADQSFFKKFNNPTSVKNESVKSA